MRPSQFMSVRNEFAFRQQPFEENETEPAATSSDVPRADVDSSDIYSDISDDETHPPTMGSTPLTQQSLSVRTELVRYTQAFVNEVVPAATMSKVPFPAVNFSNTYGDVRYDDISHPTMECTSPVQQSPTVESEFNIREQTYAEHNAVPSTSHSTMECTPPVQQLPTVEAEFNQCEQTFVKDIAVPSSSRQFMEWTLPAQQSSNFQDESVRSGQTFEEHEAVPSATMSDMLGPEDNFENTYSDISEDDIQYQSMEFTPSTQQSSRVFAEYAQCDQTFMEHESVPITTMSNIPYPAVNFVQTYSVGSDRRPLMERTLPAQQSFSVQTKFVTSEQTFEGQEAVRTTTMTDVPCPEVNSENTYSEITVQQSRQTMQCTSSDQQSSRVTTEFVSYTHTFVNKIVPAVTMLNVPCPAVNFSNTYIRDDHPTIECTPPVQQSPTVEAKFYQREQTFAEHNAVPTTSHPTTECIPTVQQTQKIEADTNHCEQTFSEIVRRKRLEDQRLIVPTTSHPPMACTPPVQQSPTVEVEFNQREQTFAEHNAVHTTSHPTMECTPPVQQTQMVEADSNQCEQTFAEIGLRKRLADKRQTVPTTSHPPMECTPPVQQSPTFKCEHCGAQNGIQEAPIATTSDVPCPEVEFSNLRPNMHCTPSAQVSSIVKCQQAFEEFITVLIATDSYIDCPEADYFKTYSLFSDCDIRKLIIIRDRFAEQLRSGYISFKKCLELINAETKVLNRCNDNINVHKMKVDSKENINTLTPLCNRINFLYYCLFRLNTVDVQHLIAYMKFRMVNNNYITLNRDLLNEVLSEEHSDPEVYVSAAQFLYDNTGDVAAARRHIAVGMRYHSKYSNLYVIDFMFETKILHENGGESLPIALEMYKKYINIFERELSFHIELLDCALQFKKGGELPFHVMNDMFDNYKLNEQMWQKLAYVFLDGVVCDRKKKRLNYDLHCKRRLEKCMRAYEDGLKLLHNRSLFNLWNFYLDHVIELWKEYGMRNESLRDFLNEEMENLFLRAHKVSVLKKPRHIFYWAEHWENNRPYVSKMAIKLHKNNITIWLDLLKLYAKNENHDMVIKVFRDGHHSLGYDYISWPLWEFMSLYFEKKQDHDLVMNFHEVGINHPHPQIRLRIKHTSLIWTLKNKGLVATRELFTEWKNMNLIDMNVYRIMIGLERALRRPDTDMISRLYFEACMKYGEVNLSLWKEGIQFAYMCDEHRWASKICDYSPYLLKQVLVDELQIEYQIIKNKYANRKRETDTNGEVIVEDYSSPDHPARNEYLPTFTVNCTPSTSEFNYSPPTSTSTENSPSKSAYSHLSTSTNYKSPTPTEINQFEEFFMSKYSKRRPLSVDPIVIEIMDDDD